MEDSVFSLYLAYEYYLFENVVYVLNRTMRNTGIQNSWLNEEENKVDDYKYLKYLWWGSLNNFEGLYLSEECKWHTVTFPFQNKFSQDFRLTNDLC